VAVLFELGPGPHTGFDPAVGILEAAAAQAASMSGLRRVMNARHNLIYYNMLENSCQYPKVS